MSNTMTLLLIVQILIVITMVLVVLFQRSGTNSLAGLSGGGHGFISGRSSGNILTKLTFFLAIAFMINSLLLARFTINNFQSSNDLLKSISVPSSSEPIKEEQSAPIIPKAE